MFSGPAVQALPQRGFRQSAAKKVSANATKKTVHKRAAAPAKTTNAPAVAPAPVAAPALRQLARKEQSRLALAIFNGQMRAGVHQGAFRSPRSFVAAAVVPLLSSLRLLVVRLSLHAVVLLLPPSRLLFPVSLVAWFICRVVCLSRGLLLAFSSKLLM
jgi:hypothetical protein